MDEKMLFEIGMAFVERTGPWFWPSVALMVSTGLWAGVAVLRIAVSAVRDFLSECKTFVCWGYRTIRGRNG